MREQLEKGRVATELPLAVVKEGAELPVEEEGELGGVLHLREGHAGGRPRRSHQVLAHLGLCEAESAQLVGSCVVHGMLSMCAHCGLMGTSRIRHEQRAAELAQRTGSRQSPIWPTSTCLTWRCLWRVQVLPMMERC